ncbi:hypothetical protein, partial [Thermomonas sp.]|uniref:hypothetical protein n=1 Tax=Thermomonas sp. TaxID=1971895 RepID=UPI003D0F2415
YERAVRQVARRKAAGALAPAAVTATDDGAVHPAADARSAVRTPPARARIEPVLGRPARAESAALAALRRAR